MTDPLNTKIHSDIKQNGWFQTFLPEKWQPFFILARLDRPIGVWLLLLPGLWSIVLASGGVSGLGAHGWYLMALFCLGAVAMRAAGCVINDLWDRDLDSQVERTRQRPLASGVLSVKQALKFLLFLLFIGLCVLMQMNSMTIVLGFACVPLIILYPLMKRVTWWPQAFLGLTFNFSALMGWSAVSGQVGEPALWLYLGGIFWTLGYDTIYAHQDKEDDALVGIKSTALKFGERSWQWVAGFYGAAFVCLLFSGVEAGVGYRGLTLFILVFVYGLYKLKLWDMNDPASSLETFKSSRNLGILILLILAAS